MSQKIGRKDRADGRTGRKDRAEGPGGRTGRKDRAEGPGGRTGRTDRADGRTGRKEGPLIWNFLEQIVFLEIGEKVSKVSKLDQFWVQAVCLTTPPNQVIGCLQTPGASRRRALRGFFFGKKGV